METVCRLSGVEECIRQQKRAEYRQLEKFLEQMIREAEKDLTTFNVARSTELVMTGLLFVSNAIVDILKDRTGVAGYAIGKVYDGGQLLVAAAHSNVNASTGYMQLAKNKAEVTDMILKEGKATSGNTFGRAVTVIDQAAQLYKWWHENGKKGFSENAGIKSGISTLNRQLNKVRTLLRELDLQAAQ
jgi:hypothetical protein